MALDNEIAVQMIKRVSSLNSCTSRLSYDVDITCTRIQHINFTDEKFLYQQEPNINVDCYYREIFDLGIFNYQRKEKLLNISYLDSEKYPFNSFEVVVDTILQFIYLIMLEFEIVPLHAAVLAYKNKAILLFGNSGSGKSTLELALLNSGFLFFSDDIAFLDDRNRIFNSGEHIIACSEESKEIVSKSLGITFKDTGIKDSVNKQIIDVNRAMISECEELEPFMIIFPSSSGIKDGAFKKISAKSTFVDLIKLTVSTLFSLEQKQIYIKRIKALSENTQAYRYSWTNRNIDLKKICDNVWELCEQDGV